MEGATMNVNPDIEAAIKAAKPFKKSNAEKMLDHLNTKYCVVQDGHKVRVHSFERHEHRGHVRMVSTFLHFAEFTNLYLHIRVKVKDKITTAGSFWLHHANRRQYEGIVFQPGGAEVVNYKLNLWRGFGVEPKPGDWSKMRKHMLDVMASGNREHFEYIMCWLAWAVQNPDRQAEVALVFKGKRGTGKGTLGNAMLRIFGQHGVHISHSDHLTGHFNNHLRDACCLFADEAYWPGDKKAEGNLKRLVTEPTLSIEGKGRDLVEVTNMLHVIIASERERRYVMLDVPDVHIQDSKWFEPIYTELEGGGYGAMLHDLLQHDLGEWHPRKIPANCGLLDQQARSLSALDAWWVELLESGRLWGCGYQPNPDRAVCNAYDAEVGVDWQPEKDAYGNIVGGYYKSTRMIKKPGLFDQARALVPQLRQHTTDTELGRHLAEQGCSNTKKVMRRQGWTFPPLAECRAKWDKRFPGWKWRNMALSEWQAEEADDVPEAEKADNGPETGQFRPDRQPRF
jgi:hypothetical protein